jgi:hypothetical protein
MVQKDRKEFPTGQRTDKPSCWWLRIRESSVGQGVESSSTHIKATTVTTTKFESSRHLCTCQADSAPAQMRMRPESNLDTWRGAYVTMKLRNQQARATYVPSCSQRLCTTSNCSGFLCSAQNRAGRPTASANVGILHGAQCPPQKPASPFSPCIKRAFGRFGVFRFGKRDMQDPTSSTCTCTCTSCSPPSAGTCGG